MKGIIFFAVDPLIVVTPLMYVFREGGSVCCWFVVRCGLSCLTNISQMKRGAFHCLLGGLWMTALLSHPRVSIVCDGLGPFLIILAL